MNINDLEDKKPFKCMFLLPNMKDMKVNNFLILIISKYLILFYSNDTGGNSVSS